ncbi:REP-associated tyrosine transposase [Fodinibius sp.]|uniref:REP-associated tyrosine transposase n=1 Tax=Fodinibius sp. TaxID=1872440 RepID=UPI002ACD2CC2|nr:transposase [Fodinibius sp.]MDZ7657813.1 transposase [Fodinibius sp.]
MSSWKIHPDTQYYFCTTSITKWYPVFTRIEYFSLIINSLIFCQRNKDLSIHAYVIMLNHMHLIISAGKPESIPNIFRDLKRHTSSEISSLLKTHGKSNALRIFKKTANKSNKDQEYKVWQSGYHPISLETEHFFKQKLNYIHHNPVHKGYVNEPTHWRYSSAANYAGYDDVPLQVDKIF